MSTELSFLHRLGTRAFWTRKRIIIPALLAVLALTYVFYPRGGGIGFVTVPATRGDLTVTVSATGTLQPGNEVDVGTEVSGKVDQVLVDYNDHVKTGQLIAVINTDTTKAQLAQYQATLAQAKATLATNQATVEQTLEKRNRYRTLQGQGGGAVAVQDVQAAVGDYDRAVASVALAKAQIQSAEAQISNTQTLINKAQVRSPIDGIVLDRKVSPGQTVAASFSTPVLFTLASDLSVMQLAVDIDEADIGSVHEGQMADFTVDAFSNRHFAAKLVALHNSPKTDNGVVTYPGVLLVDNRDGLLRPGLTATVQILVAKVHNALMVPNAALRFTPPVTAVPKPPEQPSAPNGLIGGRVWVLAGAKLQARDLIVGRSDGRSTEVVSGNLAAGEAVITDIKAQPPGAVP
jgi:HlyD family secretion protein